MNLKKDDETALKTDLIRLASQYARYDYHRIHALLQAEGWRVNHKRIERLWREESLKGIPRKEDFT